MSFSTGKQKQQNVASSLGGVKLPEAGIRVLLFVSDEMSKKKYLDTLADCGVHVFVSSSFFSLSEEIRNQTYHGLIVDLPCKMKAIKANKSEVYRLVDKFPVAHVRLDNSTGEVLCFHVGLGQGGRSLADFINDQCRTTKPRKLSAAVRREIHVPVLLFRRPQSKRPEKTFTLDISPDGCFIVTTHRYREGKDIFLHFPELRELTLVRAQIRKVISWGKGRHIPGISVSFLDVSVALVDQLSCLWQMSDP